MWAIVARRVSERAPTGLDELEQFWKEEWHAVPQSAVDALVLSFHSRLSACAAAQGTATA